MLGADDQLKTKGTKPMKHTLTLLTVLLLAPLAALHATILHLLGLDYRLTDVYGGVVREILA